MLQDLAEFHSTRFVPVLPEKCQVNEGRYGAELAFWLSTRLYEVYHVATSYPDWEDWGWRLGYSTESGHRFDLNCGNIDGTNNRWLICIKSYQWKLFGRDKPNFERASDLINAVRCLLEGEESITELDWRYDECPT